MEAPSTQEDEIPIPLNISYGVGHQHPHMINHHQASHNHIIMTPPSAADPHQITSNGTSATVVAVDELRHHTKKSVKYRECLKNHAASMGGNATDGCGEFMPSGEEGSLEALTCSACSCHRNFHRKEVEGEISNNGNSNNPCDTTCFHSVTPRIGVGGRKLFMGHPQPIGYHGGALISARAVAPHQMIMPPYSVGGSIPSESEDQDDGGAGNLRTGQLAKKRFRTKFTQEQKDKMLNFAERVGWKIQKQEEGVVQQFCQEVGVKRRVLKVWMHNNKQTLAKKNHEPIPQENQV